jgi:hypothetical protein
VQSVISVGMLNEGWDAKTVTHIMGLRAFTSQLLCEQVVGRGLRRTSYEVNPATGLFEPEYVNIFGVPFTFLPHEGGEGVIPPPPTPKIPVGPDPAKAQYEIRWPNVVRVDHVFHPMLSLNWSHIPLLELDAAHTPQVAELAPILDGRPAVAEIDRIELERLAREFRTQRIVFETARDVYDQMQHGWSPSSTATIPSAPPARCPPGTPASPASARKNRTSTSASTTARGKRRTPGCWTTNRLLQPGSRMTTWASRFCTSTGASCANTGPTSWRA